MIHSGSGPSTIKDLFATLNIPSPTERNLKKREREAGRFIEKVAQQSCLDAIREEREKTVCLPRSEREAFHKPQPQEPSHDHAVSEKCVGCGSSLPGVVLRTCQSCSVRYHHMCQVMDEKGRLCDACFAGDNVSAASESPESSFFEECSDMSDLDFESDEDDESVLVFIGSSFDTGWQKRGNGKNYNSLSGVGHVVGVQTGKVMAVRVKQKDCRTCYVAWKRGVKPKPHDCRRNWSGSSKAMEADLCVETVKAVNESGQGVRIGVIIGDDDSSAIHHVWARVDKSVSKWSDVNHAKKALGNKLYELRKSHRQLTKKVIKSAQKNFTYAMNQNKGNPESLRKAFLSIPPHMYGDHARCGSWCRSHTDPNYSHNNLPGGFMFLCLACVAINFFVCE